MPSPFGVRNLALDFGPGTPPKAEVGVAAVSSSFFGHRCSPCGIVMQGSPQGFLPKTRPSAVCFLVLLNARRGAAQDLTAHRDLVMGWPAAIKGSRGNGLLRGQTRARGSVPRGRNLPARVEWNRFDATGRPRPKPRDTQPGGAWMEPPRCARPTVENLRGSGQSGPSRASRGGR
jgi:hypothetical protein